MMVVLLLLLGFIALAAGVFGFGLGLPAKETTFGAAALVSASMAMAAGLILLGLAAAVYELRRVLQASLRQMPVPERLEAERSARRMEPRLGVPGAPGGAVNGSAVADPADVVPVRFVAPEERPRRPARDERPPLGGGKARGPAVPPPATGPASATEQRRESARAQNQAHSPAPDRFDAIRPADYRKPDKPDVAEPQAAPAAAGTDAGDVKAPPLAPAEAAGPAAAGSVSAGPVSAGPVSPGPLASGPAAIKPVRILKSGKINDVAYTLFSDGSIETLTPNATLRFASIDEFRKHLEKTA
jgi:hypothetical protein